MRCNIVNLKRRLCSARVFCGVDHAHAVRTRCMAVRVHCHCVEYVLCGGVQVGAEQKKNSIRPYRQSVSLVPDGLTLSRQRVVLIV